MHVAAAVALTAALVVSAGAHAQEVRVLASAAALETESFTRIRGLIELRDGTLLVSDQTENAVWRVDLAGGVRERVGREGAGPGEYQSPTGVMAFRGDSAVVSDLGNGRLAVLGPGLEMGRTIPMFAVGGTIAGATDTLGGFYVDRVTEVRVARVRDPAAGDRATLLRFAPGDGPVSSTEGETITHLTVAGPPNPQIWYPWDGWAVGRDGRVLVVRNQDEYRVDWHFRDGRSVRGPVVADERVEVSGEDRRIWSEQHPGGAAGGSVSFGGQPARRPQPGEFPDRFPFANSRDVWVDREGRGWVGRYEHQSEKRPLFDVFDDAGRRVARVRLPEGRQVVGFGRGALYAVRVDEVDLQWLERYDTGSIAGGNGRDRDEGAVTNTSVSPVTLTGLHGGR
jgi:hypothetical protein